MKSLLEQIRANAQDPSRALDLTLKHFQADTGTLHELGGDRVLHLKAAVSPARWRRQQADSRAAANRGSRAAEKEISVISS